MVLFMRQSFASFFKVQCFSPNFSVLAFVAVDNSSIILGHPSSYSKYTEVILILQK